MLKKIFRKLFVVGYILTILFFIAACLCPFLNPSQWWFFGFAGLVFPYLLIILVIYFIVLALSKSKWSLLAIVCFIVGWKSIYAVFGFYPGDHFNIEKKATTLRIMTWNMRGLYPFETKITGPILSEHVNKIFAVIETYNPDILSVQEFSTNPKSKRFNNHNRLLTMGYKYVYFPLDTAKNKRKDIGTAIFSKYPIVDSMSSPLPTNDEDGMENLLYADVVFGKDTIRVFSGHMQSYRFMRNDYSDLSKIRNDSEERLDASKNIFRKMRIAFEKRGMQADFIKEKLDAANYPEIFCGDLNDVPNSYPYFSVKGDKKDAFIKRGFGFGQTYFSFASSSMRKIPTLRIDYIFADPRFKVQQATRIKEILSDHIPVVADFTLPAR